MDTSIFDIPFKSWTAAQGFQFAVTYLIPIVTCLSLILGGLWALYKYFNEKSRTFYSNILESVYSPLFNELIKMEYSRMLSNSSIKTNPECNLVGGKAGKMDIKNVPFISWIKESKNLIMKSGETKLDVKEINIFNFDEILKSIHVDKDKLKYAPRDLVALIESYFLLEEIKGPLYEKEKIRIQRQIRRNVIVGYKKYRRKLGLKDVTHIKFCYSFWEWIFFPKF